ERTHRQLRARFTNRLRGNYTDRFADLDRTAGCEVTPVALDAAATSRFAGQHRTDANALHTGTLNLGSEVFVDLLVRRHDYGSFNWVLDVFERRASDNTIAQRLDFLATFHNRTGGNSAQRAAIFFADDHVLCDVDETPRQVTGVSGLERRVSQTFASAVCRDEVLQHVEALAEVCLNRSLDDFARRTSHQTAHTGELANLLRATASTGIAHDENRVELTTRAFAIVHRLEHLFRDFVGHFRPDRDHLVVAFTVGDDAVEVLLLNCDDVFVSLVNERFLRRRSYQVVDTDRDAGLGRVQEAEGLEIVKHLDGHLVAKSDVRIVNERLQTFLLQRAVDERQAGRKRVVKDHATDGRVDYATHVVLNSRAQDVLRIVFLDEVDQVALNAKFDRRLRCNFTGVERE